MKNRKLYLIDIILSLLLIVVLISSVLNETLHDESLGNLSNHAVITMHIAITLILMAMCIIHIKLHYGQVANWLRCLKKGKMQTRWVFILCTLALITGILATIIFFTHGHTPFGGIHGKIGFAVLLLMILHLTKRLSRLRNMRIDS